MKDLNCIDFLAPEYNKGTLQVNNLVKDNEFYSGVGGLIEEYNNFCVHYLDEIGRLNTEFKNFEEANPDVKESMKNVVS